MGAADLPAVVVELTRDAPAEVRQHVERVVPPWVMRHARIARQARLIRAREADAHIDRLPLLERLHAVEEELDRDERE